MDNGSEIVSDFVISDGVFCGAFIQTDLQKEVEALLLVRVIVFGRHVLILDSYRL